MEEGRLKYNIDRFDHYYDSINNKSAVYIAIITFLTGAIIAIFSQQGLVCDKQSFAYYSLAFALILGFFSLIYLAYTSIPYVSTKSDSLYFFGSISNYKKDEFLEKSKNYTEEESIMDLRNQVHLLSKGLTSKYRKLSLIGYLLIAQFVLIIPTIYLIIRN